MALSKIRSAETKNFGLNLDFSAQQKNRSGRSIASALNLYYYGLPCITITGLTCINPISLPIGIATVGMSIFTSNLLFPAPREKIKNENLWNIKRKYNTPGSRGDMISNSFAHPLLYPFATIIAPFQEEIMFRQDLLLYLSSRGFSLIPNIFISSLTFGLVHFTNYPLFLVKSWLFSTKRPKFKWFVDQSKNAFVVGLVYSSVASCFGIVPTIIAHIINNTLAIYLC